MWDKNTFAGTRFAHFKGQDVMKNRKSPN